MSYEDFVWWPHDRYLCFTQEFFFSRTVVSVANSVSIYWYIVSPAFIQCFWTNDQDTIVLHFAGAKMISGLSSSLLFFYVWHLFNVVWYRCFTLYCINYYCILATFYTFTIDMQTYPVGHPQSASVIGCIPRPNLDWQWDVSGLSDDCVSLECRTGIEACYWMVLNM